MPLYEHVFIARQDLAQNQVEALTEGFTQIVTEAGGKVAKNEYWGLRNLAYRIKKNRKGHYTLLNIDAPAAALAELERQAGLNEDIIRFQTIRVDELEDGPSAMMRRSEGRDRDDRGGRGDRGPRPGGFRPDRGPREGGFGGDRGPRENYGDRGPREGGFGDRAPAAPQGQE